MKYILLLILAITVGRAAHADATLLFNCQPYDGSILSMDISTEVADRRLTVAVFIKNGLANNKIGDVTFSQEMWEYSWTEQLGKGIISQKFPQEDTVVVNDFWTRTGLLALTRMNDQLWVGTFSTPEGHVASFSCIPASSVSQ